METYESPRVLVLGAVPTHTLTAVGASCLTKVHSGTDSILGNSQDGGEVLQGHIVNDPKYGDICVADKP